MTNGEKMISAFPNGEVRKCEKGVVFSTGGWCHAYAEEWWNAECEQPTTKNNLGVDCIDRAELLKAYEARLTELRSMALRVKHNTGSIDTLIDRLDDLLSEVKE